MAARDDEDKGRTILSENCGQVRAKLKHFHTSVASCVFESFTISVKIVASSEFNIAKILLAVPFVPITLLRRQRKCLAITRNIKYLLCARRDVCTCEFCYILVACDDRN